MNGSNGGIPMLTVIVPPSDDNYKAFDSAEFKKKEKIFQTPPVSVINWVEDRLSWVR